jgi:hypothetical protein
MVAVLVVLLIAVVALIGRAFWRNDDTGLFRGFLFKLAAVGAMVLAGLVGVSLSRLLIAWIEVDDTSAMYIQLGCFVVVLIAIGWGYDKLRERWASRQ